MAAAQGYRSNQILNAFKAWSNTTELACFALAKKMVRHNIEIALRGFLFKDLRPGGDVRPFFHPSRVPY
jgi:hypothetical protein